VQPVLDEPGGDLVTEVEAQPAIGVTDQIVDCTKAVEGAPELATKQRMDRPSVDGRGGDLQDSGYVCRRDEFMVVAIGLPASGEDDADPVAVLTASEIAEQLVCLLL